MIGQCVTVPHRQMPSCKGNKGTMSSCQADSRSGGVVELRRKRARRREESRKRESDEQSTDPPALPLPPRADLCTQICIGSPLWCHERLFPMWHHLLQEAATQRVWLKAANRDKFPVFWSSVEGSYAKAAPPRHPGVRRKQKCWCAGSLSCGDSFALSIL